MRILKEETNIKEPLPVTFLTDMMSKGWDEVGYLREASAAISDQYKDTAKVTELMQDLMDAYLVCIGQLELYLNDKEAITPAQEADIAKAEQPEAEEADQAEAEEEKPTDEMPADDKATNIKPELPEADFDIEPIAKDNVQTDTSSQMVNSDPEQQQPKGDESSTDAFEFFVDFEEPDMSTPRLTDDELYGHEDAEYEYNKLKSMLNS